MSALPDVKPDRASELQRRDSGLSGWPLARALRGIDLSLENRDRVSALPWRGQFSPLTVERLLVALAPGGALVLDPFVGSGTTLLEAARRGHPAIGFDINPAAIALARCASLASLDATQRQARIRKAVRAAFSDSPSNGLNGGAIDEAHALALLAESQGSKEAAVHRLEALVRALPECPTRAEAKLGDARATGLDDGSVGFILTSPPYINVFNYHQYGRPLTDGFGWPVLKAARSEIGSNRQNRANRFRTVIQFSIDMALALTEMSRVLVPGSTAVLVVGRESRVRGTSFLNGDLLARIAIGLDGFGQHSRAERHFVSRYGQRIYEDVLVLSESRRPAVSAEEAAVIGRSNGVEAVRECAPGTDVAADVCSAIANADAIAPSPIAWPDHD